MQINSTLNTHINSLLIVTAAITFITYLFISSGNTNAVFTFTFDITYFSSNFPFLGDELTAAND